MAGDPSIMVERDVVGRLESLGIRYYITGSWALAMYAEPRMTRDIDIVLDIGRSGYDRLIKPAFEAEFVVNDPIDLGGRWLGGLIHRSEITRVDLIFGRRDPFAGSAMDRRRQLDHPLLGQTWTLSPEDLVLAKLEWSAGISELQLRDVRSIIRLVANLDWSYLERQAAGLGIAHLLESVRGD